MTSKLFTFLLVTLALTSHALGAAFDWQRDIHSPMDSYSIVDLQWEGKIFPDGENVTLFGEDFKAVLTQIRALNPNWVAPILPDEEKASFVKRQVNGYFCGVYATAPIGEVYDQINYLKSLGNTACTVAGRSCVRNGCMNNGAIYMCNDNPNQLSLSCQGVRIYAEDATDRCTRSGAPCGGTGPVGARSPVSAQIFPAYYPGLNVLTGYSNCGDSPTKRPNEYDAPGPFGRCWS
ncbi:uncharacterized protein BDR25DRAFT_347571 [Lindgomyces ingoldianus]|uniref:Uncharacterized protein n=1 Tax=Lindgomyces ingoldianus TaxID=673940 RepID=A0ACB6Q7K6_9PLEO|nr:uncharacterized protein BDR25DRAFT_347571 [Lindgomyces ingoldianus]KAF2462829.1 hypothetical protein BDR25DRAFT_347571 [Lindgomyces ingoldianus]